MNLNYLNPVWLLSRLLEKTGIAKTYLERVELGAHFFAGATFALLGIWTAIGWVVWTLIDEFVFDGWKGRDTIIDLLSKVGLPLTYLVIVACRAFLFV